MKDNLAMPGVKDYFYMLSNPLYLYCQIKRVMHMIGRVRLASEACRSS